MSRKCQMSEHAEYNEIHIRTAAPAETSLTGLLLRDTCHHLDN